MILGIDPGINGGMAFIGGDEIHLYNTPTVKVPYVRKGKKSTRLELDLKRIAELVKLHNPTIAVIEKVAARPGQGTTSMFRFGQSFGQVEGVLAGREVETIYVTPRTWKKYFSLTKDKDDSLNLARTLFPAYNKVWKFKKNNGVAEAALLARYLNDIGTQQALLHSPEGDDEEMG